jgi:hypothetical protein
MPRHWWEFRFTMLNVQVLAGLEVDPGGRQRILVDLDLSPLAFQRGAGFDITTP